MGPWSIMSILIALTFSGLTPARDGSVLIPSSSPLVSIRILFTVGAAADPKGKEGVAALTAAMLAGGGSGAMTYEQIVAAMYPMATEFSAQVDKEMTVFFGATHIDNLQKYYQLTSDMLLSPGWREDDFKRLKEDAINFLKVNLRATNDEELGKEALYNFIYEGHPYGHHNMGTVSSLERITLDDVKGFYKANYTRANLVVGLSGGYPAGFHSSVEADFAKRLPEGKPLKSELLQPKKSDGLEMIVIRKNTRATAISFGFPISVTRADSDWPALLVAQSYFGQHRSSNGRLYQRMRQIRGLNYGDYAYIEYFPRGMLQFHPDPNLARHQQIFQVWIRPVEPQNGLFALKIAFYELKRLIERGITKQDFEETRLFLTKFVNNLTASQDEQLGYALDSKYYGIPNFNDYVRDRLAKLTLDDVNRAIRKHLTVNDVKIVVVTSDAESFAKAAIENRRAEVTYPSPMPGEILDEDKAIQIYKLRLNPKSVEVVPVEQVFQR